MPPLFWNPNTAIDDYLDWCDEEDERLLEEQAQSMKRGKHQDAKERAAQRRQQTRRNRHHHAVREGRGDND